MRQIRIQDSIYGDVIIGEEILVELIACKPVQRLKGISQSGSPERIWGIKTNRYEHSVGVMILLRIMGASVEEQIAGLLHDVPHTALSHTVDFVFNNKEQDYHEKFHHKIINASEIPQILEKHGFDTDRICNEHNFPLLERSIPNLCADRLDYSFRDMVAVKGLIQEVERFKKSLVIVNDEFIFNDSDVALLFAERYLEMNMTYWASPKTIASFYIMADILRRALELDIITEEDLFKVDKDIYDRLGSCKDSYISKQFSYLNPNLNISLTGTDYDYLGKAKFRYVDPKVMIDSKIRTVSDIYPKYKQLLQTNKEDASRGYMIKILPNSNI